MPSLGAGICKHRFPTASEIPHTVQLEQLTGSGSRVTRDAQKKMKIKVSKKTLKEIIMNPASTSKTCLLFNNRIQKKIKRKGQEVIFLKDVKNSFPNLDFLL